MFSSIINQNTRTLARIELADEQIKAQAPSVFAGAPQAGVSARYTVPAHVPNCGPHAAGRLGTRGSQATGRQVEGRFGFQKHLLRFQRRDQIAKSGEYTPEIALVNSHDRSSAYQIHAALYRFVCGNGLMVSDSAFEAGEHPAQRSARRRRSLPQSFTMLAQIPQLTERVNAFRARQLTAGEQQQFARQAITARWEDMALAPSWGGQSVEPRRTEDTGNDLWSVYNRVQENLTRGGQRDFSRRRENGSRHQKTRAVTGLDESIRLNKSLWQIAEALRVGNLAVN